MHNNLNSLIHIVTFEKDDYRTINESTIQEYGNTFENLSLTNPLEGFFLLEEALYKYTDIIPNIVTSTAIGGLVSTEMDGNTTARAALLRAIDANFEGTEPIEPALLIMSYFQKPLSRRKMFSKTSYRKTVNTFNVAIEPQESI
jgi:hypothetical protein